MCYLIVLKTRSHPLYHLLWTLLIKQNNQDGDNSHGGAKRFFLAVSEKYYAEGKRFCRAIGEKEGYNGEKIL